MKQDNCSNAAVVSVDSANDRSVNFTGQKPDILRHCLSSILLVLKLYGFNSSGYSLKPTFSHWKRCCDLVGSQMKFIKWKLPAFFAASCGQEVEESPLLSIDRPDCLLGGKAFRFIQRLRRDLSPLEWASLLSSIKTGVKKGLPRPDVEACRQGEVDTFVTLTTPITAPSQVFVPVIDAVVTKDRMISEIRRTCREIFQGKEFSLYDRVRPFFPSTSANYINTRAMGGAVGAILEHPDLLKGLKCSESLCEFEITINGTCLFRYKRLVDHFMILYNRMLKRAHLDITAIPLGLSEAMKVRVITKGPFQLYTVLKPLQRFMHSTMREHPAFSLIGGTIDETYVNSRISQMAAGKVLSVDYRNATNEIFSWPSEVAADEISSLLKLSAEETALFKTSLTGHSIELRGEVKDQVRGQLMGSITSFPILCIINAAIMRLTFELSTNVTVDLANCPLAINGDDAILRGPEDIFSIWKGVSS
nr:RNA-dependent RNA polymerase [Flumine narna-like virus 4]